MDGGTLRAGPGFRRRSCCLIYRLTGSTEVIATGWPVGASLGSEAALQQRYGVSRSVLREAVRRGRV